MDCCKRKISEVLAAHELYSLNCSLLAKQIFYLCSCSQKKRSARKDHLSPLSLDLKQISLPRRRF